MLHIKDIEAFARINEALSDTAEPAVTTDSASGQSESRQPNGRHGNDGQPGDPSGGPTHPALVMAMVATGRLPLSTLPGATPASPGLPVLPWGRMFRRS